MTFKSALTGIILSVFSLSANATIINFTTVPGLISNPVDDFYSNEGVYFQPGAWIVYSISIMGRIGVSQYTTSYMNVIGGFSDSLSFEYSTFGDASVGIFDDLNGTGTLLASLSLPANTHTLPSSLDSALLRFAGTAKSVAVHSDSGGSMFAWDDVTFSLATVPVPTTLFLTGLGLAAIGVSRRKNT